MTEGQSQHGALVVRLSVAYAGVAFRLSSAANLRGSWLKTRPRAMFRPRNHSAFSCTKVFSR